jgi:hypothetical protein
MTTEDCVICNNDTLIEKSTHVDYRFFYVNGVGQLCKECWYNMYDIAVEAIYYEE